MNFLYLQIQHHPTRPLREKIFTINEKQHWLLAMWLEETKVEGKGWEVWRSGAVKYHGATSLGALGGRDFFSFPTDTRVALCLDSQQPNFSQILSSQHNRWEFTFLCYFLMNLCFIAPFSEAIEPMGRFSSQYNTVLHSKHVWKLPGNT